MRRVMCDAFGPGYPLISPVAGAPSETAPIPIAFGRKLPARSACKDGRQVPGTGSEGVPRSDADGVRAGGENWPTAVLSHCATRARASNPEGSSGRCAPCGLGKKL